MVKEIKTVDEATNCFRIVKHTYLDGRTFHVIQLRDVRLNDDNEEYELWVDLQDKYPSLEEAEQAKARNINYLLSTIIESTEVIEEV